MPDASGFSVLPAAVPTVGGTRWGLWAFLGLLGIGAGVGGVWAWRKYKHPRRRRGLSGSGDLPSFKGELHRRVLISRGEAKKVRIGLTPSERFYKADPRAQEEMYENAKLLKLRAFDLSKDGDVELQDRQDREMFDIDVKDLTDWNYDGGEVTTTDVSYRRLIEGEGDVEPLFFPHTRATPAPVRRKKRS